MFGPAMLGIRKLRFGRFLNLGLAGTARLFCLSLGRTTIFKITLMNFCVEVVRISRLQRVLT